MQLMSSVTIQSRRQFANHEPGKVTHDAGRGLFRNGWGSNLETSGIVIAGQAGAMTMGVDPL
jgi:hypothetical protein